MTWTAPANWRPGEGVWSTTMDQTPTPCQGSRMLCVALAEPGRTRCIVHLAHPDFKPGPRKPKWDETPEKPFPATPWQETT